MAIAAALSSTVEHPVDPTILRDKEIGTSTKVLNPYSVPYDSDELDETDGFKFWYSLFVCDSSDIDNSDSENGKTKGVKRNAAEDIAPTSRTSNNISVDEQLSNVAATYLKRPKTQGSNLELIQALEKSDSAINSDEATTSSGTSKRTPVIVTGIVNLDKPEEESVNQSSESQSLTSQTKKKTKKSLKGERIVVRTDHSASEKNSRKVINHRGHSATDKIGDESEEVSPSMLIEPQSLASQPKKSEEILEEEGNTLKIDHFATEMTSEEVIQHKEHTVAETRGVRGDPNRIIYLTEKSRVDDIGYTMTTTTQPTRFQTITVLPQQEVEKVTVVLDASHQKLVLGDVLRIRIVGLEKDNTTIHFAGDKLEKESPIKCTEPRSLTSQANISEEILKKIGNTAEMDHSAPEITLKEAINHKEQTEAAQTVDEPINESPVEDVVYGTSNEDINYAMTIAFGTSSLQTMTLLPQDQVEEDSIVLQNEGDASQQLLSNSQPVFRDSIDEDEQVLNIRDSTQIINPYEEITIYETSKRQPDNVEDIICLDELEEESSIQCTEPRPLAPESKRTEKIVKNDENVVEIDHSIPEMILGEAIQHRGHIVADQGVEDHTSIRENTFEKDISKKSLSQYFGRSLDETRKIFGVSRTAFNKMCRDVGIKRWKYGERNMRPNLSKPRKRLNDEVPGRRNFLSGMPPVQDTPVVSCTNQNSNKMAVKATYNGVPIRFNLPDSSGLSELQENVIKRLHLERNNFSIKYQDDEGEWVLIACDEDVQDCVEYSKSLKKTTIKMLLDPPVDKYAPKKQMT